MPFLRHRIDQTERLWPCARRWSCRSASASSPASDCIRRVKRAVPPRPGCSPSITSGKPNRAPSIAMRDWQASATSRPPPRQKPWITATVGNLQGFEAVDHRMRPADRGLDRTGIGGAAKFIDVGAGDEAGWFCGANDDARRPLAFQRRQHQIEFFDAHRPTACWRWRRRDRTTARQCRRYRGSA